MLTRRRLLATTALVPLGIVAAPGPAGAHGLAPELDAGGRVVAWINLRVMAELRASTATQRDPA